MTLKKVLSDLKISKTQSKYKQNESDITTHYFSKIGSVIEVDSLPKWELLIIEYSIFLITVSRNAHFLMIITIR